MDRDTVPTSPGTAGGGDGLGEEERKRGLGEEAAEGIGCGEEKVIGGDRLGSALYTIRA